MQNRFTWVLRRDGDAWRVVHEHTSVPVSLDHAKAILQRV
jgi:ketosteroid isomerase-like protein